MRFSRSIPSSRGRLVRAVTALMLLVAALSSPANAQKAANAGAQRASRAELTSRARDLEAQLTGSARSEDRTRATAELAAIRRRLEEGDFRVGDQFVVTTTHEQVRVDTASVRDSLVVTVANLPDMSVRGVLRSELNDATTKHVSRYLRNATVRTNVLTRVTVIGAVGRPGVYYASPDRPVTELLMLAGGPSADAKLDELEVNRAGSVVLTKSDSKRAIREGRTIEQVDIQSGDEVMIAKKRKINWGAILQVFAIVTTLLFAVIQFLQWYYGRKE